MEKIFLIIYLITATIAAPINPNTENTILQYSNYNNGSGSYSFSFETIDGIKREERSSFEKSTDTKNGILRVTGQFSYHGPDGITYETHYVADENGFRPTGKHLPSIPNSSPGSEKMFPVKPNRPENNPDNFPYVLSLTAKSSPVDNNKDVIIPKTKKKFTIKKGKK